MKKRGLALIIVIASLFGATEGYEFAVENYGDFEIVMPDGKVIEQMDIVEHPTKVFRKKDIENLKGIVWHYTAWETQDIQRVADWHVNGNHWAGIGYHGAIKKNGDYLVLNDFETLSYHSKGSNSTHIGIVFMTDGELTDNQLKTAKHMSEALCYVYPQIKELVGHRDVRATLCPGDEAYKQLRDNGLLNAN